MAAEINREDSGSREHRDPPARDAVWYVVASDDDTQLGPMSAAEVEERCQAGELDAAAMVWSLGMSDWLPLADVPELAHLAPEPDAAAPATESRPTGDVTWNPISAEQLSALAEAAAASPRVSEHELERADRPDVQPAGFGDAGIGWSVPPPPPPAPVERSSRGPLAFVAAIAGAACVGGFVALFFAHQVAPSVSGVSGQSDDMRPHSDDPVQDSEGQDPDSPVVKETAGPVVDPPLDPPAAPVDVCAGVGCTSHGRCLVRRGKARCSCDEGFKNAGPTRCVKREPQSPPPEPPDKAAIKRVVEGHEAELRPCLARAKKPAGVDPGRYTLVVSWMIKPDGSVGAVRLVRPQWTQETSLPKCFASVMRSWKFPAPGRNFAVANYPLGNVNLK